MTIKRYKITPSQCLTLKMPPSLTLPKHMLHSGFFRVKQWDFGATDASAANSGLTQNSALLTCAKRIDILGRNFKSNLSFGGGFHSDTKTSSLESILYIFAMG